jgi:hypothetical protein
MEGYLADLEKIKNRNVRLEIDLRNLQIELDTTLPKELKSNMTKIEFEKIINQVEKTLPFPIHKETTTVASFALKIADMIFQNEEIQRQHKS